MKTYKRIVKRIRKSSNRLQAPLLIAGVTIGSLFTMQQFNKAYYIDPTAYSPLLDTIAKGESGGNYNAYFGRPLNFTTRFTDMTVSEVLDWQERHVEQGNISSAVGKYQIIRPTLEELVKEMEVEPNKKFDENLQDQMAIKLVERRGATDYVNNKLTREQFAENLSKEWAALPKTTGSNPHASYYAGDGVNKSNIAVDEVFEALDDLQGKAKKQPKPKQEGRD